MALAVASADAQGALSVPSRIGPAGRTPPPEPIAIDAALQKKAVEASAKEIRERFVDPAKGEVAAKAIEAGQAAGKYDTTDADELAKRLTTDLKAATGDTNTRVFVARAPKDGLLPAPRAPLYQYSEGGVVRADMLTDNIGYLRLEGASIGFQQALDKVMPKLKDTRALIIDLRSAGGGRRDDFAYLLSHFADPEKPTPIAYFHRRQPGSVQAEKVEQTSEKTPVSLHGKPVLLLTSSRTACGAEEFAYDMQVLKFARIVGQKTMGCDGGETSIPLPGAETFRISTSTYRIENAVTGRNWVGSGVTPDLQTHVDFGSGDDDALPMALKELGPLALGRTIAALTKERLFTARSSEHPKAAAALKRHVAEVVKGEVDKSLMSPLMVKAMDQRLPTWTADFAKLGSLKSIAYRSVDATGFDVYDMTFANGKAVSRIFMQDDGKTLMWNCTILAGS